MEVVKNKVEDPMLAVDDVVFELKRLANMLFLLSQFSGRQCEMDAEEVGDTMGVIWGYLERQIKALDAIQWSPRKSVSA